MTDDPFPNDLDGDDYLWSASGPADPEARRLELTLAPLRVSQPLRARRRRGLAWILLAALATMLAVTALLPADRIPTRIAGLFHDDFPGEIGVRGGSRIEYRVKDPALTEATADALSRRGAEVVFVQPGLVVVDVIGGGPETAREWGLAISGNQDLTVRRLALPGTLPGWLDEATAGDPELAGAVHLGSDTWTGPGGDSFAEPYLEGSARQPLEATLAALIRRDPRLAPPPGQQFAFESLRDGSRAYLVEAQPDLSSADITDAVVIERSSPSSPGEILGSPKLASGPVFDVVVTLRDSARQWFAILTERNVGHKLVIMVGPKVVDMPVIQATIAGGRLVISSASGSEGWARGLVGALKGPALPSQVVIGSVTELRPVMTAVSAMASRLVVGLGAALLVGLLAWLAVRAAPAADPEVSPVRGRPRRRSWAPYTQTLVGLGLLVASGHVPLPTVTSPDLSPVWLTGFGLAAFVVGPLLVGLARRVIPGWRDLPASPSGRRWLARASVLAILLISILQAAGTAHLLRLVDHVDLFGLSLSSPSAVLMATIAMLALAPMVLLAIASLFGRAGLVGAPGLLMLGGAIEAAEHGAWASSHRWASALGLVGLAGAGAVAVAATSWALRRRVGGGSRLGIRLPAGGILAVLSPHLLVLAVVCLDALVPSVGAPLWYLLRIKAPWLATAMALALTPAIGWIALRVASSRSVSIVGDVAPAAARRRAVRIALVASSLYAAVLIAVDALVRGGSSSGLDIAWLGLATAAILDLVVGLRAHGRRDDLVAAATISDPQVIDLAVESLVAHGIDVHVRGAHLRSLLVVGGSLWPATVEVPSSRRREASQILASVFADAGGTCNALEA